MLAKKLDKVVMVNAACLGLAVSAFGSAQMSFDPADPKTSYVDGAVSVSYDGDGAVSSFSADVVRAGGIDVSGGLMTLSPTQSQIVVTSSGMLTFGNALSAHGECADSPAIFALTADWGRGTESRFVFDAVYGGDYCMFPNTQVSSITNLTAGFDKTDGCTTGGIPGDGKTTACFVNYSGGNLTCQFQKKTSDYTMRAVVVELRQKGEDVWGRCRGSYTYSPGEKLDFGEGERDLSQIYTQSIPYPYYTPAWFVTNLTAYCERDSRVILAADNGFANAVMRIGGQDPITVLTTAADSTPLSGRIEVLRNGRFEMRGPNAGTTGNDKGVPIVVKDGGAFYLGQYQLSAGASTVILDGGHLDVQSENAPTADSYAYVNRIEFNDGASADGCLMRVRSYSAKWIVGGSRSSACRAGASLWGNGEGDFVVEVADVTRDEQVDFFMNGRLQYSTLEGWDQLRLVKQGTGTMLVDGDFVLSSRPTLIEAGMLMFGNGRIGAGCAFEIAGGVLGVAAASTNACASLKLLSSGGICISEGGELDIASSSAEEWATDAVLTVSGDLATGKVRFGTDKNGLTRKQLRKIVFDGADPQQVVASLDERGYLTKVPRGGLVLTVR